MATSIKEEARSVVNGNRKAPLGRAVGTGRARQSVSRRQATNRERTQGILSSLLSLNWPSCANVCFERPLN